jgi:hypothetical protein
MIDAVKYYLGAIIVISLVVLAVVGLGRFIIRQRRSAKPSARQGSKLRDTIISTFEQICLAIVVIPSGLAIVLALSIATSDVPLPSGVSRDNAVVIALIFAAAIFLVTAFLAGGALTLVSIMENTREIAQTLESMRNAELRSIADDIQRLEGSDREARNLELLVAQCCSPTILKRTVERKYWL